MHGGPSLICVKAVPFFADDVRQAVGKAEGCVRPLPLLKASFCARKREDLVLRAVDLHVILGASHSDQVAHIEK